MATCDGNRLREDFVKELRTLVEELTAEEETWVCKAMSKTLVHILELTSAVRVFANAIAQPKMLSLLSSSEAPCAWERLAAAALSLGHFPTPEKIRKCFYHPNHESKARCERALQALVRVDILLLRARQCTGHIPLRALNETSSL